MRVELLFFEEEKCKNPLLYTEQSPMAISLNYGGGKSLVERLEYVKIEFYIQLLQSKSNNNNKYATSFR